MSQEFHSVSSDTSRTSDKLHACVCCQRGIFYACRHQWAFRPYPYHCQGVGTCSRHKQHVCQQRFRPPRSAVWHAALAPGWRLYREGGLREEGAHVAPAAQARQAQALRGVLHDVLHRPEEQRLRALLRRLRAHRAEVSCQPSPSMCSPPASAGRLQPPGQFA